MIEDSLRFPLPPGNPTNAHEAYVAAVYGNDWRKTCFNLGNVISNSPSLSPTSSVEFGVLGSYTISHRSKGELENPKVGIPAILTFHADGMIESKGYYSAGVATDPDIATPALTAYWSDGVRREYNFRGTQGGSRPHVDDVWFTSQGIPEVGYSMILGRTISAGEAVKYLNELTLVACAYLIGKSDVVALSSMQRTGRCR